MEDAVRNAPLFLALDEEASVALRASMVEIDFNRGQIVFSEGDPGDRLYVIMDGKIKLGTTSNDGRESLLAVLGPGEMFGELSLFDPGPRTATATALTETILLGLGHEALGPWLTGRPGVAEALLKALAQRLRRTNENLSDLVLLKNSNSISCANFASPVKFRGLIGSDSFSLIAFDCGWSKI